MHYPVPGSKNDKLISSTSINLMNNIVNSCHAELKC